jgi:23S rRNA (guanosine2251-2'-O)-methyltransferase
MKARSRYEHAIWISGYNPVRELLFNEDVTVKELILARSDQRAADLEAMAIDRRIPVRHESADFISGLVGHAHHQGLAIRSEEFHHGSLEVFLQHPIEELYPLVVLDSIQDPQNLGALIRSACFLGAKGLIVPKDRSARITGTVIKVASGATVFLPIIQVTNLIQTLDQLKNCGLWIFGLDVGGKQSLYDADLSLPLGLVVGNEQKGLRPLVRRHCDFLVRIPAGGPLQSLNAATAGAIALAEVQRQRGAVRK